MLKALCLSPSRRTYRFRGVSRERRNTENSHPKATLAAHQNGFYWHRICCSRRVARRVIRSFRVYFDPLDTVGAGSEPREVP
jgi:hypothetical protein